MAIVWLHNLPHLVSQFFNNTCTPPLFQRILVVVVEYWVCTHLHTHIWRRGGKYKHTVLSLSLDLVSISTLWRPSETTDCELTFQVSCRAAVADAHRDLSQVPKHLSEFRLPEKKFYTNLWLVFTSRLSPVTIAISK